MALTKVKSGVRTLGTGEVATANMATDPTNASNLASGTVPTARLGSGSASSGTFLRGDGSWNTAGVSTLAALTDATISASDPAGDSNPSAVGHLWINSTSGEAYIATRVTTDDNYWTNIGSGSGNIAPLEDIIDYLVIGGGGGAGWSASTATAGGQGGGGAAGVSGGNVGTAGTVNTGGGGGGSHGANGSHWPGASGGSGIVVIRYDTGSGFLSPGDLTLVSNSTTAEDGAPTKGDVVMTYTNGAGTATLNTDLKGYVSRDNGSNWTQGTLVSQGTTGGHIVVTFHDLDISGQPSGTSMRYKITTHNQSAAKETRIQAVSLGWS